MISLLKKSKNKKSYQYIGHLQWVVFLLLYLSTSAWACMPAPIEIDFKKINKTVLVEATIHRVISLRTSKDLSFNEVENLGVNKIKGETIWGNKGGYYINPQKPGEYSLEASDGDKKIQIKLIIEKDKTPAFGQTEGIPRSAPKSKTLSNKAVIKRTSGCGGPSKVEYN